MRLEVIPNSKVGKGVCSHPLCGHGCTCDLLPSLEAWPHFLTVRGSREPVTPRAKVRRNGAIRGEEPPFSHGPHCYPRWRPLPYGGTSPSPSVFRSAPCFEALIQHLCHQPQSHGFTISDGAPTPHRTIPVAVPGLLQTSSETSSVSVINAYRAAVWPSRQN